MNQKTEIPSVRELAEVLEADKRELTALETKGSAIKARIRINKAKLYEAMADPNLDIKSFKNEHFTFTREQSVVPVPKDWDLTYQYILENQAFHLLERRLTVTSFREMFERGITLPGVEAFIRNTIRITPNRT